MSQIIHVCDAFTNQPYYGNPAAVCISDGPVDESWMKLIAREMNLSETAFIHPVEGGFSLRWLTPAVEVDLCGHATLASAFTLWYTSTLPPNQPAKFSTRSGWLTCNLENDWISMDFPARQCQMTEAPTDLAESLGTEFSEYGVNGTDCLVRVDSEAILRGLKPNMFMLQKIPVRGVIVTSESESSQYDFCSRFFAPASGVDEDPVTGSAHCALGPYWAERLGKTEFTAFQASQRGGTVKLVLQGDRVLLRGQAVMSSRVELL